MFSRQVQALRTRLARSPVEGYCLSRLAFGAVPPRSSFARFPSVHSPPRCRNPILSSALHSAPPFVLLANNLKCRRMPTFAPLTSPVNFTLTSCPKLAQTPTNSRIAAKRREMVHRTRQKSLVFSHFSHPKSESPQKNQIPLSHSSPPPPRSPGRSDV